MAPVMAKIDKFYLDKGFPDKIDKILEIDCGTNSLTEIVGKHFNTPIAW